MNDFIVSLNAIKRNVKVLNDRELLADNKKYNYELIPVCSHSFLLRLNDNFFEITAEKLNTDLFTVLLNGHQFDITVRTALQEKAFRLLENSVASHHYHRDIKAPMPGLILKIKKKIGDKVELGESVMILEAMKMENDLKAPASGTIENIAVSVGSAVEKGTILFSIG
jgi:biotin carboxyl carrier protein